MDDEQTRELERLWRAGDEAAAERLAAALVESGSPVVIRTLCERLVRAEHMIAIIASNLTTPGFAVRPLIAARKRPAAPGDIARLILDKPEPKAVDFGTTQPMQPTQPIILCEHGIRHHPDGPCPCDDGCYCRNAGSTCGPPRPCADCGLSAKWAHREDDVIVYQCDRHRTPKDEFIGRCRTCWTSRTPCPTCRMEEHQRTMRTTR